LALVLLGGWLWLGMPAQGQQPGGGIGSIVVPPSPPPPGYRPIPRLHALPGDVLIANVPAYSWCYGCSPTAAGMLAAYYALRNFPAVYTGPAGTVPMYNETVWGATNYAINRCGECPFIASHFGIDGRATRGHADDYFSDNGGANPYLTNAWTPHADDSLADYMGTSRSIFGNATNGSTMFFYYQDGTPLSDYIPLSTSLRDGCHGIRAFLNARGYTVTANYTQLLYNATSAPNGCTFAQYCAEIDAGNPMILQLNGHTMLGMGYNKTGNIVYVHTTWTNIQDQMTWGGTFHNMQQWGVTVIHLALPAPVSVTATKGTRNAAVSVNWSSVPVGPNGHSFYRVYRGTSPSGSDRAAISGWLSGTTYSDSSTVVGTTYTYWVTAAASSAGAQESPFGSSDTGWSTNVTPANDPPTLAVIPNQTVNDNSGAHTLTLSGITPGDADDAGQTVTISALSSYPALLPNPVLHYSNPSTTGTLTFTPAANSYGTALVTVTVKDSGGTANGGGDTLTRTFLVTILRHQPDLTICNNGDAAYIGSGIYNTTGASESKTQAVVNGVAAIYLFRVQNAGKTTDSFTLTTPAAGAGWKIKCVDHLSNSDITASLTATAGWTTIPLAPGVAIGYTLYVTPDGTVASSAVNTVTITVVSVGDKNKKDAIKAITSVPVNYQPDLTIRNSTDASYLGTGIYNLDGTNQTKAQAIAVGTIATYLFHVQNNGNTADSITLTCPAIASGWTATYYNASGTNITTLITGTNGWTISKLAPGAIQLLYTQITPGNTVAAGTFAPVTLTAVSAGNPVKKDVVKAITTRQ